jgi:hypothetical protein
MGTVGRIGRFALLAVMSSAAACTSNSPRAVASASAADRAALIDRVKLLEGEWETVDDEGSRRLAAVYKVSSGGSIVREIMFPGSESEMTNVYHMDGSTLMLTHYCAMSNQPRMRARADGAAANAIDFESDGVTNWTGPEQMYMGRMRLEFTGSDRIVQRWWHIKQGETGPHTDIVLTRKKS